MPALGRPRQVNLLSLRPTGPHSLKTLSEKAKTNKLNSYHLAPLSLYLVETKSLSSVTLESRGEILSEDSHDKALIFVGNPSGFTTLSPHIPKIQSETL